MSMPKASEPASDSRLPLSRERVLQAAIALADQNGLDSLSMRKLAQNLSVEAMSLYNHIANKDDLIDGMVDIVAGKIALPVLTEDWQQAMRDRAHSAHAVLLCHPWATMAIVSRANVGPAMLRYVDQTLGCLIEAGFSYEMADHAWNAMDSYIYGFTLQELNFPFEPHAYQSVAASFLPNIPAEQYPYLNLLTHHLIEGHYDGIHEFDMGLELILKGLDELLQKA